MILVKYMIKNRIADLADLADESGFHIELNNGF